MLSQPSKDIYQSSRQKRYAILVSVLALAAILGVVLTVKLKPLQPSIRSDGLANYKPTLISEITVGSPVSLPTEKTPNPPVKILPSYTTLDKLALRVVTSPEVVKPYALNVRLLTPANKIIELDPTTVNFFPGTSTFCCWQIGEPGDYTLQIFRPEKIVSTVSLKITKAFEQESIQLLR